MAERFHLKHWAVLTFGSSHECGLCWCAGDEVKGHLASFGLAGDVYSTGNGSAALLGFGATKADTTRSERLSSRLFPKTDEGWNAELEQNRGFGGVVYLDAISKQPPLLRGVSWAAEEE